MSIKDSKIDQPPLKINRRTALGLGVVTSMAFPMAAVAQPPARQKPQAGDFLVFEEGPNQGEVVRPELLQRNGSRLNRVMITRIDAEKLTARYQRHVAEGVIAYSIVCTHTGCDVTNWDSDELLMACPCHESQFDIYAGGSVVGGPALRPLAMLPLTVNNGEVMVAASFSGKVGFSQQF